MVCCFSDKESISILGCFEFTVVSLSPVHRSTISQISFKCYLDATVKDWIRVANIEVHEHENQTGLAMGKRYLNFVKETLDLNFFASYIII